MKFTIKLKLGLVFLVFFVTLTVLGSLSIHSLMTINDKNDAILKTWMPGLSITQKLDTLTSDYQVLSFQHVAAVSAQDMLKYEQAMEKVNQNIVQGLDTYALLIQNSEYDSEAERKADQDNIDQVRRDWSVYLDKTGRLLELSRQGEREEALQYQEEVAAPAMEVLKGHLDGIVAFCETGSTAIGNEVTSTYIGIRWTLLIVILVALMIGSAIIYKIRSGILSSVGDLLATSKEIAKGNLRVSAQVKSQDELGELAVASNQMAENIRRLIAQIQRTSEQLAASSEELTASAEQSALATQNVANSISNVSAMAVNQVEAVVSATGGAESVSAGLEESTQNLQEAAEKTLEAVEMAKDGTFRIDGAVSQMNHIEETVNQLAAVVSKLGERSKEIGQIVDTISGIAGQTNLLALNAAIEAARAGEMGKGFAVVAEEVRKLAEQSQGAAHEIADLVVEIQTDTEQAVVAMDRGTQEVKTGTQVVSEAGGAFASIYQMVDTVNQKTQSVTAVMEKIASQTQQVTASIHTIENASKNVSAESQTVSAATEEQSASMEQIASSSRSLAQLAEELTEMSNQFKI